MMMHTMQTNVAHKTLAQLLPELRLPNRIASVSITGLTLDSRQIQAGDVFIALIGDRVNGQQFIGGAIKSGAAAVLIESTLARKAGTVQEQDGIPIIAVANLADRVSELAGLCYEDPSRKLKVIGVTGTNGKSTCVSLIAQLYELCLGKAATLGTLGVGQDGAWLDLGMTTPDPVTCQRILADLVCEKAELVAMEVSSHGLDQNRVAGIQFHTGVFTNITHDHLDYHGDFQQYAKAKRKLFELEGLKSAVINLDDPHAPYMVEAAKKNTNLLTYSMLHFVADVYASDLHYLENGVRFQVSSPWGDAQVFSPLLGEFNVYNLLAAITTLATLKIDFSRVIDAIPKLKAVPGRMQRIESNNDVMVVVDYAHTPDALAQAIAATRAHTRGALWVIFGCGGDRDRSKRAPMARIAERFADHVVVTSDNPRTESPENIISEICLGFVGGAHHTVTDREEAIIFAVQSAQPGDVILVAGKGHENYQIVGDKKLPFDDVSLSQQALAAKKARVSSGVSQ